MRNAAVFMRRIMIQMMLVPMLPMRGPPLRWSTRRAAALVPSLAPSPLALRRAHTALLVGDIHHTCSRLTWVACHLCVPCLLDDTRLWLHPPHTARAAYKRWLRYRRGKRSTHGASTMPSTMTNTSPLREGVGCVFESHHLARAAARTATHFAMCAAAMRAATRFAPMCRLRDT